MNLAIERPRDTSVPGVAELLDRARQLAPRLRERAGQAEQMRRVPDETVNDYKAMGLIRATQPKRFGGYEIDWDTLCEVSQILAAGCGSQAWIQRIMADHAQMLGTFPVEAQDDVWRFNEDALISASFDPVGRAEPVQGGFLFSGRHGFSSGVDHADWVICGGYILRDGAKDGPHFFLVPRSDITIVDDWNMMGLSGTGSKTFEVANAFIPEHRVLDGKLANRGEGPGTKVNKALVYRIPRGSGITTAGFAALTVGMAKGVLQEWLDYTRERKSRGVSIADLATTQEIAARSSGEIAAAEALYLSSLKQSVRGLEMGQPVTPFDKATSKRNVSLAAQMCLKATTRLFNSAGGRALTLDGQLQRQYRNLLGAASHHALVWETAAVEYGALALKC